MTSNIPDNSKLDEAVKNTLINYEASSNGAEWSRMERMLDAAPKSSSFKWSYAIASVLGLALIGGGYFAYTNYSSKQNTTVAAPAVQQTQQVTAPAPKPVTTIAAPVTTTPEPVITQPSTTTPAIVPETKSVAAPTETMANKKESKPADLTTSATAKEDKAKKQKATDVKAADPNAGAIMHQRVSGMGNEPVFGDMLDSSRGIIGETKEKDETKKAAKAKKDVPVGWNAFMLPNVNTDSLRKYKDRRDSLKVN